MQTVSKQKEIIEYVIIKVTRHEAKKTGAFTRWVFSGFAKMLYSTFECGKTHWFEYWIVEKGSKVREIRRTNRGNIFTVEYQAEELKINRAEEEWLNEILKGEE
jgi:hypothetical protein